MVKHARREAQKNDRKLRKREKREARRDREQHRASNDFFERLPNDGSPIAAWKRATIKNRVQERMP